MKINEKDKQIDPEKLQNMQKFYNMLKNIIFLIYE